MGHTSQALNVIGKGSGQDSVLHDVPQRRPFLTTEPHEPTTQLFPDLQHTKRTMFLLCEKAAHKSHWR